MPSLCGAIGRARLYLNPATARTYARASGEWARPRDRDGRDGMHMRPLTNEQLGLGFATQIADGTKEGFQTAGFFDAHCAGSP